MPSNKIILGFVGDLASGKGTICKYLKEKYNVTSYRFSTMLRDILNRIYVEQSRPNLQDLSTFLRQRYGQDIMSTVIAKDVQNDPNSIVAVEGIRRPTDITYLKDLPGFVLIALAVSERTRFERLLLRAENPDDQKKTWEQFQAEGRQESEQKIAELMREASYTIDNNGSMDELFKQVDEIVASVITRSEATL